MKAISTLMLTALLATSLCSFSQTCTFSTSAPAGAPGGPSYLFASDDEGFKGDFTWTSGGSGRLSSSGSGIKEVITPIYFLTPGSTQLIVRFTLERTGSADVTGYTVKAEKAVTTVNLCSGTVNISPNSPTTYYLTIPTTGVLPNSTNFKLHIAFTTTGGYFFDNFASTAAIAGGILPVKFSGIDVKKEGSGAKLTWNVKSEESVSYYEVEKSMDGVKFSSVGRVAAASKEIYSFTDVQSLNGKIFYRIKSIDLDGAYKYSPVATFNAGKSSIVLNAFPLPAKNQVTIQHPSAIATTKISLSGEDGRIIKSVIPSGGAIQTIIDLSSVKAGMYFVRFESGDGNVETMKIIKQ